MSLYSEIKEVAELIRKVGDVDLYRRLLALQGEVMDLTHQNHEYKQQITELTNKLAVKASLTFRGQFYWSEGDSLPFCPKCFEADSLAIHLVRPRAGSIPWRCPNCKNEFTLGAEFVQRMRDAFAQTD